MPDASGQLTLAGAKCATLIRLHPEGWSRETDWLRCLADTYPTAHPTAILDPIASRLRNGWDVLKAAFPATEVDRFHHISLEDSRRIILLTALTFNYDFSGTELGLVLPREVESDLLGGRAGAWLFVTAESDEQELLELVQFAISHYVESSPEVPGAGAQRSSHRQESSGSGGSRSDSPSSEGAAGSDIPPAPLTATELGVLRGLRSFDPDKLAKIHEIEARLPDDSPGSDKTIRDAVLRLIELGLCERPRGPRQGARLTTAGRRRAGQTS